MFYSLIDESLDDTFGFRSQRNFLVSNVDHLSAIEENCFFVIKPV